MKILIFSLGLKGFSVLKALAGSGAVQSLYCVIGRDDGVTNDYSAEQISFCKQHDIGHCLREEASFDKNDRDFFLAVGWRWLIRDIPQEKLIVLHDSLLPKYRGFAPLVNALIKKEKKTGVTAVLGAQEYDRGNILLQKTLKIGYPTHIAREIERISKVYAELAVELFEKLENKTLPASGRPQDENEASYSLWRDEDDYRIDWNKDARDIEHFIKCVNDPYRGASAMLDGGLVRILDARAQAEKKIENRTPGKVIFAESGLPVVVCGKGLLLLADVRNERGESMLPLKHFRSRFC